MIKFGSVCSGIEAASVAWNPLGWKAAWLSEIDKFPSAVLAHHYPDVPNFGDMTTLPERIKSGNIEAPDVLSGGTPCQAFSVAGLRKSLNDARGNLSLTFCEIANEIDSARLIRGLEPAIIFWENVPGVLNTKDNAFGCFLAGLAGEDDPLIPSGGKWTSAGCVFGPERAIAWRVFDAQYFGVAQRRRRVFVVASARKGFDPAKVLFEFDGLRRDIAPSREARKINAADHNHGTGGGDNSKCVMTLAHGQGGAEVGFDLGPCLTCNHEAPIAVIPTPVPFDTTQITSKANGSNPKAGDPCHPLSAGAHAPAIAFAENSPPQALLTAMKVRRLTPVECERLQGFPDFYTQIPWRKKPADLCPDGPRYKALGNSWAVPNVAWIGKRIDNHLKSIAEK